MATPDEAVGPEVGALFVSLVGATLIAGMSVWLLRKLVARVRCPRAPSARRVSRFRAVHHSAPNARAFRCGA
jgi:hypothetical protein